jgi:hypothetical protein
MYPFSIRSYIVRGLIIFGSIISVALCAFATYWWFIDNNRLTAVPNEQDWGLNDAPFLANPNVGFLNLYGQLSYDLPDQSSTSSVGFSSTT